MSSFCKCIALLYLRPQLLEQSHYSQPSIYLLSHKSPAIHKLRVHLFNKGASHKSPCHFRPIHNAFHHSCLRGTSLLTLTNSWRKPLITSWRPVTFVTRACTETTEGRCVHNTPALHIQVLIHGYVCPKQTKI